MRNVKLVLALGLIGGSVAACTGDTGYGSSYPYPTTANNRGYYSNGVYYSSNTAYANNGYSYNRAPRRGPNGDYDGDGIPNRYDRDANGDGIPDRWQR